VPVSILKQRIFLLLQLKQLHPKLLNASLEGLVLQVLEETVGMLGVLGVNHHFPTVHALESSDYSFCLLAPVVFIEDHRLISMASGSIIFSVDLVLLFEFSQAPRAISVKFWVPFSTLADAPVKLPHLRAFLLPPLRIALSLKSVLILCANLLINIIQFLCQFEDFFLTFDIASRQLLAFSD
jgi:hypothetical protein